MLPTLPLLPISWRSLLSIPPITISSIPILLAKVCLVALATIVLRTIVWLVNLFLIQPFSDPLDLLPGPRGSMLESHLQQVMDPALSPKTHQDWRSRFGQTFSFHGFGKYDLRMMSFDFRVVAHVLGSSKFEKPWQTRSFLGRLIGRGIFSMEGTEHKMQRRIIAPAFTQHSIKQMTPVFFSKAEELLERWRTLVLYGSPKERERGTYSKCEADTVIDVAHWISRAAFDVIGLAGFNYDFHALKDDSEDVYTAYRRMFNIADKGLGLREIFELYFPFLRKIWVNDDINVTNQSLQIIAQSGRVIVEEKKAAFIKSKIDGVENKDLLSLLIKSNLSDDTSKQLTDRELLDQCSTFLLAGSDTVSVALAWCLHLLSLHPDIQMQLRNEINRMTHTLDGNTSDASVDSGFRDFSSKTRWEAIENLQFLDFVVQESLRFCPPVHATIRVAAEDDLIPISHPVTLKGGHVIGRDCPGYVKIRKGTYIHIPIEGLSFNEDIWGKDALEFKPERWKYVQQGDPSKPGINNLMTFGYGSHSCLGYRFSYAEIKIFLTVLLPHFEFAAVPDVKIGKFNSILTRPYITGKWSQGAQLPVIVRLLKSKV